MYVPVAIIMSAAALEANCSEIIQDRVDELARVQPPTVLLKELTDLSAERSGHAMARYEKLAKLLNAKSDVTSAAWQNAEFLFRFRNSLMHFKPAWDSEKDVHDSKLVQELKKRVPISPAHKPSFIFPYGFMTYAAQSGRSRVPGAFVENSVR